MDGALCGLVTIGHKRGQGNDCVELRVLFVVAILRKVALASPLRGGVFTLFHEQPRMAGGNP